MKKSKEIDENLYSRQLYVLGHEAMKKMAQSNVLIIGVGGLGVEIAKNVILTGVNSVTLYDTKTIKNVDLSSQFYASPSDIGKNRAAVSIKSLKELNSYVEVSLLKKKVTEKVLQELKISVVVVTDDHISNLVDLNETCRKNSIKFIACESRGLCGALFVDCGKNFEIVDADGEPTTTSIITSISNGNPGVVTVDESKRHMLYTGDHVLFEGIDGMKELNDIKIPIKVTSTGMYTFQIMDTSNFSKYKTGGYVKQIKMKKTVDYKSLKEALKTPTFTLCDFGKMERPQELHCAFQALPVFIKEYGRYPGAYNKQDAENFIKIALKFHPSSGVETKEGEKPIVVDTKAIELFSYTCQGNLNPIAAFIGGVAAQEVQKSVSGKFSPLNNYLYFDAFECLPKKQMKKESEKKKNLSVGEIYQLPDEDDCKLKGSRYDGQIVVFGNTNHRKIAKAKTFVVGAGALGCEYLKNYAMMGVGSQKGGLVTVTDMDNIEISNLNRQFLFRRKHVGKIKSTVAGIVAKQLNPDMNIKTLQDKVAPETEMVFNDEFWESQDFITNALDNIKARLYVDTRCVYYHRPLLESGTLGTKGNVQVVIPFLTESYGSSRDPPEKAIPICTLKNFPYQIEHTIQYGRDLFEGLFNKVPKQTNMYAKNTSEFLKKIKEEGGLSILAVLEDVKQSIVYKPQSFNECIVWARLKFQELFHDQISQLLYNFPKDLLTSTGIPFWGGTKKPPTPIVFSENNKLHLNFIISTACLRGEMFNIKPDQVDKEYFVKVLQSVKVARFKPKDIRIATTKEEAEELSSVGDDEQNIKKILSSIPTSKDLKGHRLTEIEFEKDDDSNRHIDFITAASNLRATNYKIPVADKHKTKGIAGKIIPAMVTTTSLITGLTSLEAYKIILGVTRIEDFKNSFVNIALPFVTQSEPVEPAKEKYYDTEWSLWDRFDINLGRDVTLQEFMDHFEKEHNLLISMLSCGRAVVYSFYTDAKKLKQRKLMKMSELVEKISQKPVPDDKYMIFEMCATDLEDEDLDVPYIRYKFRF